MRSMESAPVGWPSLADPSIATCFEPQTCPTSSRTWGSSGSTGPSSSTMPRTTASCHRSPGSSFSLSGSPRVRRLPLGSTCTGRGDGVQGG